MAGVLTALVNLSLGWEFWVPPLILGGLIALWVLHVAQIGTWTSRENYFLIYSMLVAFYHGVHSTSFFDIIAVFTLLMATFSMVRRREFLALLLGEFFVLMIVQTVMMFMIDGSEADSLTVFRIIFHCVVAIGVYKGLNDALKNNRKDRDELEVMYKEQQASKEETEDFLVNISHELRTPVNVINGMSSLILKKEDRDDVVSIRDAGLRLSGQIEDIQDYSEIQRGDVILEEEKYMITSLLNDIISNYQVVKPDKNIDLIVDLDPSVPAMMRGDAGKISRVILHLLDNAIKFTDHGGVYLKVSSIKRSYGVNLVIEVTDTGKGMGRSDIEKISQGIYQANTKRNRNTGGIGLGLSIVYGFVRKMNGFVNIESRKGEGTTVRVSIAQSVIDPSPCLSVDREEYTSIAFHVMPEKYDTPKVRDFYRMMAASMASGLRMNLYSAPDRAELDRLTQRSDITHIFMGQEEYVAAPDYFDDLVVKGFTVAVSAKDGFKVNAGSGVIVMPKPLYGCPVVKVLNGDIGGSLMPGLEDERRPVLEGIRALVVDDEPMNLVVATGIFKEYRMYIDTAASGKEAIEKYRKNEYDIVFMDHMMPEMDGVEAMKHLKEVASDQGRVLRIIALTANAISGAREMFLREGFDEFISKPIHINEFERTVSKVLPRRNGRKGAGV